MRRTLALLAAITIAVTLAVPAAGVQPTKPKKTYAQIQFLWGYLRAPEITAPQGSACRNIPLIFEVRNANVLPMGFDMQIGDDFAKEYAFTRIMATGMTEGKNYGHSLKVCGAEWVGPHLTSNAVFAGVQRGSYYLVATEMSMAGVEQSHTTYRFK